ncbi:sucrase/ferredoxin-like family protein, putative [Talaromyces stipitatus ATCC 10500]|uniref:Defect at low temperature protein 1 n=1 Tax=Talaromyces stipitatus (strain ATCC 10500 / CBS 375.48 / QM 6759 / NRRL 1006) TaxID=441959 RepID=B8LVX9_TALSN|nr:sucrase/ferredoxin-like family protein, putative [Talaromyces stipitatus ATCC 10500]EED24345.1 sucrase/ferredoxin-like family protein, putative [Talaromyces stipitatus ATCC 10500]
MNFSALSILNSTVYTILTVVLLVLTLLTPGDFIYQCRVNHRLTNIIIVTGVYVLTVLVGLLIYASRIYTNRTVLSGIPKAWIPVSKGEVDRKVQKAVEEGLNRSAIIAFQARPRNVSDKNSEPVHDAELSITPDRPPWGSVSHAGWSAPSSIDFPGLRFESVIEELPHLIEAKAVSLVPSKPPRGFLDSSITEEEYDAPDPRLVELLQRPSTMGLREYIAHLTAFGLINPPELRPEFLAIYERARFSSRPLFEDEFRALMQIFAEILRGMKQLDYEYLEEIGGLDSRADSESFIGPSDEEGETDTLNSEENNVPLRRERSADSSGWSSSFRSAHTAPMVPSPTPSRPEDRYASGSLQNPWSTSLSRPRSIASQSSGSGSVIRLTRTRSPTDLPYEIDLSRSNITGYDPYIPLEVFLGVLSAALESTPSQNTMQKILRAGAQLLSPRTGSPATITSTDNEKTTFKTAPTQTALFPKVDPAVDGEDCDHDCASCTVHYPARFDVEMNDKLYGHVNGWSTHVLVATGKTDWVRDVADEKGSVMEAIEKGGLTPSNGNLKLSASNIPVPDEYHHAEEDGNRPTTVVLLPAFKIIDHVTPALAPDLIKYFVNPSITTTTPLLHNSSTTASPEPSADNVEEQDISSLTLLRSRPLPHAAVILLCSQKTRDARCGQSAPLLKREFERHLRTLGLYRDANDERPGGVAVHFISHVGGHKYSANVIIYRRRDFEWYKKKKDAVADTNEEGEEEDEGAVQGIWLARVRPEECENIVRFTVLQGKLVKPDQLRGGFDREKGLISW